MDERRQKRKLEHMRLYTPPSVPAGGTTTLSLSYSGYVVYGGRGLLEVEIGESTVVSAECNNMRTKINILVVVVQANFFVRNTNLV